eukprot:TRINITY_DN1846_c0_g2_i1.p5 TRINITY_DN1846_c0_g2~~TRINITY_DN1846_c0_g2_i1.p5  ORF type:complete len:131 (-),score=2.96 TRINITY_DN1846_c0_g2_i1:1197-1589(-)
MNQYQKLKIKYCKYVVTFRTTCIVFVCLKVFERENKHNQREQNIFLVVVFMYEYMSLYHKLNVLVGFRGGPSKFSKFFFALRFMDERAEREEIFLIFVFRNIQKYQKNGVWQLLEHLNILKNKQKFFLFW